MDRLDRAAIVASLTRRLEEAGSWCGETHLQKATYFYQELFDHEVGFAFVMYKHGPFSFDLRDALTEMRADGFLELVPRPAPYGPSYRVSETGRRLESSKGQLLEEREKYLQSVASTLGTKTVADLEALATSLYVQREEGQPPDRWVDRLLELKPHVSRWEAERALDDVNELVRGVTT
jgi:uncharacterized protein YwgA